MTRLLLIAATSALMLACQNPRSSVTIPATGPAILVANPPQGALLFLDGKLVGEAQRFNGNPEVLQVPPGSHLVELRQGDRVLRSERLFFGGTELRTLHP